MANPEKFEEEDEDDGKPAKKRQKTERFTRGNSGCFLTKIKCPRCRDVWNTRDLGLEDSAYNFLMQVSETGGETFLMLDKQGPSSEFQTVGA